MANSIALQCTDMHLQALVRESLHEIKLNLLFMIHNLNYNLSISFTLYNLYISRYVSSVNRVIIIVMQNILFHFRYKVHILN